MPVNEYALELLVRERLSEARRAASRRRSLGAAPRAHPTVRAMLGGWLLRLGARLLADPLLDAR